MKKLTLFIALTLIIQATATSQPRLSARADTDGNDLVGQACLSDGITFTSQAQIDNFSTDYPGCTEIEGNLTINGADVTNLEGLNVLLSVGGSVLIGSAEDPWDHNPMLANLSGLENLNIVGGDFKIYGCVALTTLNGLENLSSIGGGLRIYGNDALSSLSGLENLNSIIGSLTFDSNPALTTLNGLENLSSIGRNLVIYGNDTLSSLTGLENLVSIGLGLTINENTALTSLSSLKNLDSIPGNLHIGNNKALITLSGLEGISSVGKYLRIIGNDALSTPGGLDNLESIGEGLTIGINPGLSTLSGLDSLESIGGSLSIYDNSSLTSLSNLENLISIGGNLYLEGNPSLSNCEAASICSYLTNPAGMITIQNNAEGCGNIIEVAMACGTTSPCLEQGNYLFMSQYDVDHFPVVFPDCSELAVGVVVEGSDIIHLDSLEKISSIDGDLNIRFNDALVTLNGMNNLTSIDGSLFITENPALANLSGLENLENIGGSLDITSNHSLANLSGLENLSSINGELRIEGNSALTNLTGLENLISIRRELIINNNESLLSLTGLENLISVHQIEIGGWDWNWGGIYCYGSNPSLESIAALNNLTSIQGDLSICCAPSLASLTGLENISSISGDLTIAGNDMLASPDGLLNLDTIFGNLVIGLAHPYSIFFNSYLGNPNLDNLNGLNNLSYVGGSLDINGNQSLTNVTGLENLSHIGHELNIRKNVSLTSLNGLEGLTFISGNLTIDNNGAMTSLTGLENLEATSIDNLTITHNSSLSSCEAEFICEYLANPNGEVEIHHNAPGCNSIAKFAYDCGTTLPCLTDGNYYFYSQDDIDYFPMVFTGCDTLIVGVTINGNDITNLNGLSVVKSITGNLVIGGDDNSNPLLASMVGLDSLTFIGGDLEISNNSALTSLSGLDNISAGSIGDLEIINNPTLLNCAVKSICKYISNPNGEIRIENNGPGCESQEEIEMLCNGELCPFEYIVFDNQSLIDNFQIFFPDCNEINGDILIGGNNITRLTGLENITSVGGYLIIGDYGVVSGNPLLTNLNGLENLNNIGDGLLILGNESLTDISGLGSIGTDLAIMDNKNLSLCNALAVCNYLANPNGQILIQLNAPGCNSQQEVLDSCLVSIDTRKYELGVSIHPNPFYKSVLIEYELKHPAFIQIFIYNFLGEQVEVIDNNQSQGMQQVVWNAEGQPAGIYFCVIKTESGTKTMKMIKLN